MVSITNNRKQRICPNGWNRLRPGGYTLGVDSFDCTHPNRPITIIYTMWVRIVLFLFTSKLRFRVNISKSEPHTNLIVFKSRIKYQIYCPTKFNQKPKKKKSIIRSI